MTLPTGTISFNQLNTETRRTATATLSLNDFYLRDLAGVGAGAAISMNNLRGKQYRVSINTVISSQTADFTLIPANIYGYIAGITDLTLTVSAGILVYASSTGVYALTLANLTTGDTFKLVNNGTIAGHGGAGGTSAGAAGGPAINLLYPVTITCPGYIGGGGGGGGGRPAPAPGTLKPSGGGGGAGAGAGGAVAGSGSGGAGGWTIPGVGGAGGVSTPTPGIATVGAGGAGGAGGGGGGFNRGGAGGSGGAVGGNGVLSPTITGSKGAGGGGGWGASGGSSTSGLGGGGGGKAINLNGMSVSWVGGLPTTRVFGAIS